jgi:hypothetical protein
MAKDTKFRADVAERVGLGFELPKPVVVPCVPSEQSPEGTEESGEDWLPGLDSNQQFFG